MKLSVLVPCYNEENTIKLLLEKLLVIKEVNQVIVVDDASVDKTNQLVNSFKDNRLICLTHQHNRGKGAAIQTGLTKVSGTHVLIQDADLEYDPSEIPGLLEPIKNDRATVVYGSRFLGPRTNMFYWHYVGNRFLNFVINILFNSILTDMETCYKIIPTTLMRELNLRENDFRIEPEITCKLLQRKISIMEVPISFAARTYAQGKKITWRDGFKALDTIFRLRFGGE